jgi:hypothetical protein
LMEAGRNKTGGTSEDWKGTGEDQKGTGEDQSRKNRGEE